MAGSMELHVIPVQEDSGEGKYILYRPLAGLAFVGNQAMVELATAVSQDQAFPPHPSHDAASLFLEKIGFLESDPAPPAAIDAVFRPTTAVLLMTNQCQLRCTYCYAAAGELTQEELTPELGCAAIDYVCQVAQQEKRPLFELSFHGGGEPTFAWHVLKQCVDYARKQPLPAKITLTSNGIWSSRQCAWIIENLDGLSLSVDGTPETQNRQRPFASGHESSGIVRQTIAELDRHHFPYGIRMTATAPWHHFPEDVYSLCEETNCQSIQVEPAFNTGRGGHGTAEIAEYEAFAQTFMAAYEIASSYGRHLHYAGARLNVVSPAFCVAPYNALIVNPRGELVTCYEIAGGTHPLARLSRIGRIENGQVIINRQARQKLHRLMAERRATCRDCFCYWSCAGDCYTRSFQPQPGGHLEHGHRCLMNRVITQDMLLNQMAGQGGVWHRWLAGHKSAQPLEAITI